MVTPWNWYILLRILNIKLTKGELFSALSATWPVVMAMDIVAMVSYIYYGKSVVQVLSPRGKVWVWDSGVGLNMPSSYSGGRALSNPFV